MFESDAAVAALIKTILAQKKDRPDSNFIWLADEHPIQPAQMGILPRERLLFISNRFDQHELAVSKGILSRFSDFEIKSEDKPEELFIRVPKERPLTHFLLSQASKYLSVGGKLWLFGYKNEGIKTHIKRASALLDSTANVSKGKNQLSIACLKKNSDNTELLSDEDYLNLRQIEHPEIKPFWSKPGIYGWDKIDAGSDFLIDTLSTHEDSKEGLRILDIGCGYGYLSLWAAQKKPTLLTATDNCFGALEAASKNLEAAGAEVQASNAGDRIIGEYDLILSNPPFHQGFTTTPDLHQRFLKNTHRLLGNKGIAWFVVNQFLPLEKVACENHLIPEEIARGKGFKVLRLTPL